jgi:hypothetical protein
LFRGRGSRISRQEPRVAEHNGAGSFTLTGDGYDKKKTGKNDKNDRSAHRQDPQ